MTKLHALRAHLSVPVASAALALAPAPADAAPKAGVRLRILNVNIFYGGDEISPTSGDWCHRSEGCPENLARMIDAIVVSWKAAPGMRWDWLAIFAPAERDENPNASTCNATTCGNGGDLLYEYTRTAIEGSTSFGPDSAVGSSTWPLQPGNYEIRLLLDDGYRSLASSAPFKVVNP